MLIKKKLIKKQVSAEKQASDEYKLGPQNWSDEDEIFSFEYDPARVLYHSDFDSSLSGWVARTPDPEHYEYNKYEVIAELTDEEKHSGNRCLKVSGRQMNWNGATIDITPYLKKDIFEYEAMVWVKFGEPVIPQRIFLCIETHSFVGGVDFPYFGEWDDYAGNRGILSKYKLPVGCGPDYWDTRYPQRYTTEDGWLLLRGKLEIRVAHHERVLVYIQTGRDELNTNIIYIDDFVLLKGTSNCKTFVRTAPKEEVRTAPAPVPAAQTVKNDNEALSEFEIRAGQLIKYNGSGKEVTIPDGVTSISNEAFKDCTSIESVTIPDSVQVIGDYAFSGCINLSSVKLPSGIEEISSGTFNGCGITSIEIPSSVKSVGGFSGCTKLTNITLPNGIENIGNAAFLCTGLTEVIIPEGVTNINSDAFASCENLKSITIPDSISKIGDSAFKSCGNLSAIKISAANWERFKSIFENTAYYAFKQHEIDEEKRERKEEEQLKQWSAEGKCLKCGGNLGLFKKCKACGVKN